MPTMPIFVYGMGMEAFGGSLVLVGGTNNDVPQTKIYSYNPNTQEYNLLSETGGRGRIDTTIIGNTIYVPGGISESSSNDNTIGAITLLNPLPALDKGVDQLIVESKSDGVYTKLGESAGYELCANVSGLQFYSTEEKTLTRVTNAYVGSNGEWIEL